MTMIHGMKGERMMHHPLNEETLDKLVRGELSPCCAVSGRTSHMHTQIDAQVVESLKRRQHEKLPRTFKLIFSLLSPSLYHHLY